MKVNKSVALLLLGQLIFCISAIAQTTPITYQGRLTEAGALASGTYLMEFKLYDAATGGTQIGSAVANPAVAVANGVFTINLDFGAAPFSGADRYLEIGVKKTAGQTYTILNPRQQIAWSPYAIQTLKAQQAENAASLGGVPAAQYVQTTDSRLTDERTPTAGSPNYIQNGITQQATSNFNISGNGIVGGSLGIGTINPAARLDIRAPGAQQRITDSTSGNSLVLQGGSSDNMKVTGFNYNTFTPVPLYLSVDGANTILNSGGGNVGIGTTPSPFYRLDVAGPIQSVGNSTHFVAQTNGGTNSWARFYMRSPNRSWFIGTSQNFIGDQFYLADETGGQTRLSIQPNGGAIGLFGSLIQNHPSYGTPHAMLYIDTNGAILRCYNGVTGAASGNCGFSVLRAGAGQVNIDFGFEVQHTRFVSITPGVTGGSAAVINFLFTAPNVLVYLTYESATYAPADRKTMVIVY